MGKWTREELQQAHDHYLEVAQEAGRTNDWRAWADNFTEDATYIEHHYGTMQGRENIYEWISETMAEWPNSEMKEFPHDWCVCDEERGWWICQIENRFRDPGDGEVYQAYNLTVLKYAGDMKFSSEEDAYNPANFAPVVKAWIDAERRAKNGLSNPWSETIWSPGIMSGRTASLHRSDAESLDHGVAWRSKSVTGSCTPITGPP